MSVRDPNGRQGGGRRWDGRSDADSPLTDLVDRLAEARRSGEPAPEELERLVTLLSKSGYEPGAKLTEALEGLARWSGEPQQAAPYPQDDRRAPPSRQPVPEELERRLAEFATSLTQRPRAERKPQPATTPPVASLRSALADISARQKALDAEEEAPAPRGYEQRPAIRIDTRSQEVRAQAARAPEPRLPDIRIQEPRLQEPRIQERPAPAHDRYAPPAPARPAPDPAGSVVVKELRSEIDRLGRAVSDLPTRAEVDGLVREMGTLASRLTTDRPARLDRDSLAAIDSLVAEVDRMRGDAASPQMIVNLAEELHAISARLDVIGPKNSVAIDTLARRIDEVRSELDHFPRSSSLDGVATEIKTVIARLEAQERIAAPTREAVVGLSGRVEALDGKIAAIQQASAARDDALERINSTIRAELDNMPRADAVTDLGRQLDALTENLKSRSAIGPALKAVEGLAGRVEVLDGKIDAIAASRNEAIAASRHDAEWIADAMRGEFAAVARPEALDGFGRQIEALTATLKAQKQPEPVKHVVEALSGEIAGLGDRLDKVANATRERGVTLDRIEAMTASLATRRTENNGEALESLSGRVDGLGDRMEQMVAATRARAAAFDRIEDSVRVIAERLVDERAGSDRESASALEAEVVRLVEGLDRNDDRMDDLHAAFQGLAARIERSCADLGAHCVESAVAAARDAIGAGADGDDGRELDDEIARAIDELRASSAQSERRAADALEAVRSTLERLIDRMDDDRQADRRSFAPAASFVAERERPEPVIPEPVRSVAAPAPAIDPAEAARAAARRALEEIAGDIRPAPEPIREPRTPRAETPAFQPIAELAPDHPLEPGSGPRADGAAAQTAASFIAAARRAAAQPLVDDEPEAKPAKAKRAKTAAGPSRFAGAFAKLKTRGRPLLLGVAATLVVLAALYVASGMTGQQQVEAPPAPTSQLAPAPTPRVSTYEAPRAAPRETLTAIDRDEAPIARNEAPQSQPPAYEPRVEAEPAPAGQGPQAALLYPPRTPAKDLTNFAFAEQASGKARGAEWKVGEPATTGSISRGSDELPETIGSSTLRMRAVSGDPSAQLEIGDRLLDGRNVEPDAAAAAKWLEKAAAQGLAPAQHRLGSLYEKGRGVTRDLAAARRLYEQAAASGNVRAMHNLGVLHAEGGLGKADFGAAVTWFRMGAERGLVDSQYNLAVLNARGLGGKRDLVDAYKWFALAAKQGDEDASRKREEVASALGASVGVAKAAVEQFRPRAVDAAANDAPTPPGGWDRVAAAKTTR